MTDRTHDGEMVTCGLCHGRGAVEVPLTSFPPNYVADSACPSPRDGLMVVQMECPVCFGHGKRIAAAEGGRP